MNGVGKLSSVKTGTPAAVVVNRQNLHLNSRILGCVGSGESHQVSLGKNGIVRVKTNPPFLHARITLSVGKKHIDNYSYVLGCYLIAFVMGV
jgi:hypothetical protein